MVVEVIRADITDEERKKRLHRIELIAGNMLKDIKKSCIKSTYVEKEVEKK